MAVLPGSLDYLYHNGILDHIPYEAYETLPVNTEAGRYSESAMSGNLYKNGLQKDTFSKSSEYTNPYRIDKDSYVANTDNEYSSVRKEIIDGKEPKKEKVLTPSVLVKGAIGVLVMLGTVLLLVKGRKKP